jgi:hypothetical protein
MSNVDKEMLELNIFQPYFISHSTIILYQQSMDHKYKKP